MKRLSKRAADKFIRSVAEHPRADGQDPTLHAVTTAWIAASEMQHLCGREDITAEQFVRVIETAVPYATAEEILTVVREIGRQIEALTKEMT